MTTTIDLLDVGITGIEAVATVVIVNQGVSMTTIVAVAVVGEKEEDIKVAVIEETIEDLMGVAVVTLIITRDQVADSIEEGPRVAVTTTTTIQETIGGHNLRAENEQSLLTRVKETFYC